LVLSDVDALVITRFAPAYVNHSSPWIVMFRPTSSS
jgi:hypothetical protein